MNIEDLSKEELVERCKKLQKTNYDSMTRLNSLIIMFQNIANDLLTIHELPTKINLDPLPYPLKQGNISPTKNQ